ncbi:MAG: hypothetical protein ABJD66_12135 [Cellulophaga sp.]|uniref:hypothetical protein n=1 Tax=Cellulophaga sp. TaxID=1972202 RepID=UPI0032676D15
MSLPKEFYIVIYKDESIERIEKLTDVFRADVKLVFSAKCRKVTAHNTFYNYEVMNSKGVAYKNNSFTFNGIKCQINSQEQWRSIIKDKGCDVLLSFDVKDKLGNIKEIKFHNSADKVFAFKALLMYLTLLNRVATHQGALEVSNLRKEVNDLKRKLNRLEK